VGSDLHASCVLNTRFAFALLRPFLLTAGVIDEPPFEHLYHAMLDEMQAPSLAGWQCL
jgi:hypothetical protein